MVSEQLSAHLQYPCSHSSEEKTSEAQIEGCPRCVVTRWMRVGIMTRRFKASTAYELSMFALSV